MDEERAIVIPGILALELYESYQDLTESCLGVSESVTNDGDTFSLYMPTHGATDTDHCSTEARKAAVKSMTQLFVLSPGEVVIEAGLLCASPTTIEAIEKLNLAKIRFKEAIQAIRTKLKGHDLTTGRLGDAIDDQRNAKGYRSEALKKALGTAGIGSLDLKRCYAQIRIMPPNLDVFSWTWATNHTRIEKVTVEDALVLIDKLPSVQEEAADVARSLLSQCSPGEVFAKKVALNNQLRANYAYWDEDELVRRSCSISGVVLVQDSKLPRYLWREDPASLDSKPPRLQRNSTIASEPFIQVLDLYRYV